MWARPQLLFEKVDFVTHIINSRRQRRSGSDRTCSRNDLPLLDIGKDVEIGTASYVGTSTVIGDNLEILSGSLIPQKAKSMSKEDVALYVSPSVGLIMWKKAPAQKQIIADEVI